MDDSENKAARECLGRVCDIRRARIDLTRETGVEATHYLLYFGCYGEGGDVEAVALERAFGGTPKSVISHLGGLETLGYIVRCPDPGASGCEAWRLTTSGEEVFEKLSRRLDEVVGEFPATASALDL